MSIDLEQFHQVFFEESFEGLEIIEQSLLDADAQGLDNEIVNTIFRAAHSIKGGSGTFGFDEVTEFTHVMETLLDEVRDGKRTITDDTIELLLKSSDALRSMIESLQENQPVDTTDSKVLIEEYNKLLREGSAGTTEVVGSSPENLSGESAEILTDMIESLVDDGEGSTQDLWTIEFIPEPQILLSGNEPARIFRELAALGKLMVTADHSKLPSFDQLVADECYLSWTLSLEAKTTEAEILEVFDWVVDECELKISQSVHEPKQQAQAQLNEVKPDQIQEPEVSSESEIATSSSEDADNQSPNMETKSDAGSDPKKASTAASSIRVGIDKVDSLINLVGELVITQSMLTELGSNFEMDKVERLSNGLEQLLQNTKELQESVMRIRMLPISFAFNRFPRMIRDLAKKTNKKVDLVLVGENTELDKTVMEQIGDPLVHLVRNAIDHGIEPSDVRLTARKPEVGTIKLDAYHRGGNIVIEISDDGNGIDPQVIFKKAVEKGIVKADEALTNSQIFDLIFEPGFSTAATVSDISGRGVGMDVVRRNITALGGQIEIESELGVGSIFRIYLPLTLAILDGQLVRVGSETYIVPLISIVESLQIKKENINKVAGNMIVYRLREDNVPIVPLYNVFGIEAENVELDDGLLVVVESGGQKIGILVDDLLAQQQVVVKSLQSNYRKVPGVSGATILGDGSVSLILDVPGLMGFAANPATSSSKTNRAA